MSTTVGNMTVHTNNALRLLISWPDLTESERAGFDWMDAEQRDGADFVRYLGHAYALSEFTFTGEGTELRGAGWDGYIADSAFSATLVRVNPDGDSDRVVMGRVHW